MFGCTFPLAAAAQSRAHRPSDMSRTTKCRGRCTEPYLRSAICALPLRFACLPAIGNQVTPTPFRAPTILRRRPGTDSNETLAASRPFDVPPARQPVTPRAAARRGPTALRLKTIAKACSSRARAKPHRATAMSPPPSICSEARQIGGPPGLRVRARECASAADATPGVGSVRGLGWQGRDYLACILEDEHIRRECLPPRASLPPPL